MNVQNMDRKEKKTCQRYIKTCIFLKALTDSILDSRKFIDTNFVQHSVHLFNLLDDFHCFLLNEYSTNYIKLLDQILQNYMEQTAVGNYVYCNLCNLTTMDPNWEVHLSSKEHKMLVNSDVTIYSCDTCPLHILAKKSDMPHYINSYKHSFVDSLIRLDRISAKRSSENITYLKKLVFYCIPVSTNIVVPSKCLRDEELNSLVSSRSLNKWVLKQFPAGIIQRLNINKISLNCECLSCGTQLLTPSNLEFHLFERSHEELVPKCVGASVALFCHICGSFIIASKAIDFQLHLYSNEHTQNFQQSLPLNKLNELSDSKQSEFVMDEVDYTSKCNKDNPNESLGILNSKIETQLESSELCTSNNDTEKFEVHLPNQDQSFVDLKTIDCIEYVKLKTVIEIQETKVNNELLKSIIMKDLLNTIESNFNSSAKIHFIGSRELGIAKKESDMDIIILDNRSKEDRLKTLSHLFSNDMSLFLLKNCTSGKSPRMKLEHIYTGIDCDIFIDASLAVHTKLLEFYISFDDRVRWMLIAVREWASNKSLSKEPLSSCVITWLVLFFLMQPGYNVIPCVLMLGNDNGSNEVLCSNNCSFNADLIRRVKELFNNEEGSEKTIPLLLESFFCYYSLVKFKNVVVSPLRGKVFKRDLFFSQIKCSKKNTDLSIDKPFILLDPTLLNKNMAYDVEQATLDKFYILCKNEFMLLYSSRSSQNSCSD